MGNRPEELRALLDSVAKQQRRPTVEVVVVGNGVPAARRSRTACAPWSCPENLGIPGGRNVGIEAFGPGGARRRRAALPRRRRPAARRRTPPSWSARRSPADPELGIISFRIADPDTGVTQRRHVPRLRASDPMRSSRVTTFLGGANAVRTAVFAAGRRRCPTTFFYAHEETDLAWRALDAGWLIDYRSDMVLHHPTTAPSPARGLPPDGGPEPGVAGPAQPARPCWCPVYLGVWVLLTLARRPSGPALRAWLGGFQEGWTHPLRSAPADEVAYGLAADPAGPTAHHLRSSDLKSSVRKASDAIRDLAPARIEDESVNCERYNAQGCGRRE